MSLTGGGGADPLSPTADAAPPPLRRTLSPPASYSGERSGGREAAWEDACHPADRNPIMPDRVFLHRGRTASSSGSSSSGCAVTTNVRHINVRNHSGNTNPSTASSSSRSSSSSSHSSGVPAAGPASAPAPPPPVATLLPRVSESVTLVSIRSRSNSTSASSSVTTDGAAAWAAAEPWEPLSAGSNPRAAGRDDSDDDKDDEDSWCGSSSSASSGGDNTGVTSLFYCILEARRRREAEGDSASQATPSSTHRGSRSHSRANAREDDEDDDDNMCNVRSGEYDGDGDDDGDDGSRPYDADTSSSSSAVGAWRGGGSSGGGGSGDFLRASAPSGVRLRRPAGDGWRLDDPLDDELDGAPRHTPPLRHNSAPHVRSQCAALSQPLHTREGPDAAPPLTVPACVTTYSACDGVVTQVGDIPLRPSATAAAPPSPAPPGTGPRPRVLPLHGSGSFSEVAGPARPLAALQLRRGDVGGVGALLAAGADSACGPLGLCDASPDLGQSSSISTNSGSNNSALGGSVGVARTPAPVVVRAIGLDQLLPTAVSVRAATVNCSPPLATFRGPASPSSPAPSPLGHSCSGSDGGGSGSGSSSGSSGTDKSLRTRDDPLSDPEVAAAAASPARGDPLTDGDDDAEPRGVPLERPSGPRRPPFAGVIDSRNNGRFTLSESSAAAAAAAVLDGHPRVSPAVVFPTSGGAAGRCVRGDGPLHPAQVSAPPPHPPPRTAAPLSSSLTRRLGPLDD